MAISRPYHDFRTMQIVGGEAATKPYVGFEHLTSTPDGWQYDIKRWCSPFDLKLPTLPRLSDPSTQGVIESEYFKLGVGDVDEKDLLVERLSDKILSSIHQWVPDITDGYYYRYRTPYFYYGDNSRVQYVDPANNRSGRNVVLLDAEPLLGTPILAANFKRHPTTRTVSYRTKAEQRVAFTGLYQSGEELQTVTDYGKILWDNIDTTKREFIVDTSIAGSIYLKFNRDFVRTYGTVPTIYNDLAMCEFLGTSDGTEYQVFYAENFPILPDSTYHLYLVNTRTRTWEEPIRVDTWFELLSTASYPGIRYFVDRDLHIIYFGGRANGGVPAIGLDVVITYRTTLRIEYEENDFDTNITAYDADTNPLSQHIHQGFVCITHENLEPTNIVLKINKDIIPFITPTEYGPITVGSDHAVLQASVTNVSGTAVPNTTVTFTMAPDNVGYLGGSTRSSSVTDGSGKAHSSYQPPVSAEGLGYYSVIVRDSTHPDYTSHREVIITDTDANIEGKESDTYLYQVLKDDPVLGHDDFDAWLLYNVTAPAWVKDADDYAKWKSEFIQEQGIRIWNGLVNGRLQGRRVVVYEWDGAALDPTDGSAGAYIPLRPELIEKITDTSDTYYGLYRLIYPAAAIPYCDPDDSAFAVGGYWIVVPRTVTFQAYCWSSYYNRNIFSNKIMARVSLPDYLLGEYINAQLQKIPFGWKLPSYNDNVAAGLNGATFITINPRSGSYPVIDLVHGTGQTGDTVTNP